MIHSITYIMDNNIVQELTQKLIESHACVAFMFTKDGKTQGFFHGTYHHKIATIANEIDKDPNTEAVIRGAINLVDERRKQS